nr:M1 family aminopeptidase [Pyrinomonadaceae bacterium]
FPKYDLVLIPEFPFGGMEHAGATFLRESAVIFPQEPTRNDHISRATLIFHEAAHQWFGDTVTMRWFDDLWLKEGFATFTAYKAMEKIMPEMNAWKVFYERIKQGAYQTDSTRGTTPIYQEIKNLSAAKSAYGNIVYNKAPAFLRQAEFYLGEDKFRTAVRAFLKKHEFGNAGWEDLVKEFEAASEEDLKEWANAWVKKRGVPIIKWGRDTLTQTDALKEGSSWTEKLQLYVYAVDSDPNSKMATSGDATIVIDSQSRTVRSPLRGDFQFPNYEDYGYGIFLLDEKSRDYVLKNIQNEKDPFLRSMMWGALWDSVREGELDPREYVELVVKVLVQTPAREQGLNTQLEGQALANARASAIDDESTTALLLNRVGTAMNYYVDDEGVSSPTVREGACWPRAPLLTCGLLTPGLLTRLLPLSVPPALLLLDPPTEAEFLLLLSVRKAGLPPLGLSIGRVKPPATAGGADRDAGSSTLSNGPAANAKTYVLICVVSANSLKKVVRKGLEGPTSRTRSLGVPFETTLQSWGRSTLRLNLAFRSGWSNTGNAVLASDGTKSE